MIAFAIALLCLSALLFTVPPIVARGWDAVADWKTRPEPKILMGGLIALTTCIFLVPVVHQDLILESESVLQSHQADARVYIA